MDAISVNSVSHCSSTMKVVMLNYTETKKGRRGRCLPPVTNHTICLPGSFPPALIPDTARCREREEG